MFNSYEMFYDRTRKRWPLNTGHCLIEVTTWESLSVPILPLMVCSGGILSFSPGLVKPKTIQLVSTISTHQLGVRTKTGVLNIRIMCPRGATCLPAVCCFNDITLKSNYVRWSSTKQTSSSHQKGSMFSLWYSWRIAHLALNNNHSLTHCFVT
jgi:hypothetical protein